MVVGFWLLWLALLMVEVDCLYHDWKHNRNLTGLVIIVLTVIIVGGALLNVR